VDRVPLFPYVPAAFTERKTLGSGAYGAVTRANVRLRSKQLRAVPQKWLTQLPRSILQYRLERLKAAGRGELTDEGATVAIKALPKADTSAREAKAEYFAL